VAVVGRPNVGKSSLFNRLAGQRLAIVHDEPGVTRDRHYADVWALGRPYVLVDTGGFDPETDDPMGERIREQVAVAVEQADVVVCVLDAATGVTDADTKAVRMLRKAGRPVIYAANKADSKRIEDEAADLYRLGIPHVYPISVLHGRGIGELEHAIVAALPAPVEAGERPEGRGAGVGSPEDDGAGDAEVIEGHARDRGARAVDGEEDEASEVGPDIEQPEDPSRPMRIALVGRPNAGKSSLLNRIIGEERVLVDERPGTTRDAIDIEVEREGRSLLVVDTAGIRRKGKVAKEASFPEAAGVFQAIRAMETCDVAVLLCDAAAGVAEQDAKILGLAMDRGRATVIALNKIDVLKETRRKELEEKAREVLSFVPWAPIVPISAKTGRGVRTLMDTLDRVFEGYRRRIGTGELNRFFDQVLTTHPPPTMGNRAPRLYFITQAETSPPLFVVMTNEPDHIHFSYRRFLINQLRKAFGFEGVPIRVVYKRRRRRGG
jgi:GTP-binding protein